MVRIELGKRKIKAQIHNLEWRTSDPLAKIVLDTTLPGPGGPPTYDPDPDLTAAEQAVKRFGGKITFNTPPDPEPNGVE